VLDWLLRFTRFPDDGSANLCTLVTFQRKTYFTFHCRPKRRRQTGPFRAELTCKCPLIVCAMTYNYFLKLYFFLSRNFVRDSHFSIFPKGFYFSVRRSISFDRSLLLQQYNLTRKHHRRIQGGLRGLKTP